ncbi:PREDICTED: uncharacterized protein LOC106815961 [Priapulus caudatus]|uniref:Uncharacterized protein LOC106815961 n=1 Tax=Priapulus caudatus TaxID=37621 RepID=A0ABM1EUW1_PRICU|nr:PREDICTED: uncharacterized protein LOC106815961 [Priapulus caudatus]
MLNKRKTYRSRLHMHHYRNVNSERQHDKSSAWEKVEGVSGSSSNNMADATGRPSNHTASQLSNDSSSMEDHALMFSNIRDEPTPADTLSEKQNGETTPAWIRSAPFRKVRHPSDTSLLTTIVVNFLYLIAAVAVCCPVAVCIAVAVPIGLLARHLVASFCCWSPTRACACHCGSLLSPADAFWLHDSNVNRSVMQTLLVLEKGLDLARVRELLLSRLVMAEGANGRRLYPRFTRTVRALRCGYAWVDDDAFSIDNHVFAMPSSVRTRDDLERYLGELAGRAMSPQQPLWEVHVAFDCGECRDTAIVLRVHQTLSDGAALCRSLCRSVMDQRGPEVVRMRAGGGAALFNAIRALLVGPLYVVTQLVLVAADCNYFTRRPPSGRKRVVWSDPIHMAQLERIKSVSRSSMHDILLSIVSGCLRTYQQTKGVRHPRNVRALVPFDFRADDGPTPLCTEFALVPTVLPSNVEGLIPRLWKIKRTMDELKNGADSAAIYGLVHVLTYVFPAALVHCVMSHLVCKSSVIVSSMSGPTNNMSIASREVKAIVSWFPTRDELSISISLLSYDDQLRIAILTDEAIIKDPEVILKEFQISVNHLSELLANRRIPGEARHRDYDFDEADEGPEPSVEELQQQLHHIQDELMELKQRIEARDAEEHLAAVQYDLSTHVEELKEEFAELLAELRRRKNSDVRMEDDDVDFELLRRYHRKRSLSASSRKSSVSTARPLTAPDSSRRSSVFATKSSFDSSGSSPPSILKRDASMPEGVKARDAQRHGSTGSSSCHLEQEYDVTHHSYRTRVRTNSSIRTVDGEPASVPEEPEDESEDSQQGEHHQNV